VVLQGRDTAGKDGTLRGLSRFVDIQGVHTASFKVPTAEELAHDFLWRIHPHAPAKGQISFFNRSHYEDVLVVRVHNLAPEGVWRKRYDQINEFEELLAENGTIIVKFCLHIDKAEQEVRLLAREQEVAKAWKLSAGDWKEREFWDAYTDAYDDAMSKCSPDHAPWHVVPADRKWFRDLAVTETLVETLRPYRDGWMEKLARLGEEAKKELAAFRV
jgi:PPK2 family polyphosphate:nucleotide phosphotransferase